MRVFAFVAWVLVAVFGAGVAAAASAKPVRILTGAERGIGAQVARDIDRLVARQAGLELRGRATAGSVDSLQRLRGESGSVSLALLPADTAAAYLDVVVRGNPDAAQMMSSIRVIAPLYDEEIYFIVRSDSSLNAVHEIRDQRISVGLPKSSESVTLTTLYRLLFGVAASDDKLSFLDREEALIKLVTDQTIDVVAFVSDQPDRLLAEMKPEARRFVKLLRFDARHPTSVAALDLYSASVIKAASYPKFLTEDLPALAVRTYLVAHGTRGTENDALIGRFATAWCQQMPRLKADGHAALGRVELGLPELLPGWHYARPAAREIARCTGATAPAPAAETCSTAERILGLCD